MRSTPLTVVANLAAVVFSLLLAQLRQRGLIGSRGSAAAVRLDAKEVELSRLPVGLAVTCTPNPARAVTGGRSRSPYTWRYETSVRSTAGPLRVVEFGAFVWTGGQWQFSTFTGRPFTAADFADWYGCPLALVEPWATCTDPSNWSAGATLRASKTKWYYIAVDAAGKRYKGECVLNELAELATSRPTTGP